MSEKEAEFIKLLIKHNDNLDYLEKELELIKKSQLKNKEELNC